MVIWILFSIDSNLLVKKLTGWYNSNAFWRERKDLRLNIQEKCLEAIVLSEIKSG